MNDEERGTYNTNSQIKIKTARLKSSFFAYSDAYILVKGNITVAVAGADSAVRNADERNKQIAF